MLFSNKIYIILKWAIFYCNYILIGILLYYYLDLSTMLNAGVWLVTEYFYIVVLLDVCE